MKNKFKKIMAVVATTCMVGSSIGMAVAAGGAFPGPFVQDSNADYAIVYGANAAQSDITAANSLDDYLNTFYSPVTETETVTETTTETIVTSDFSSSVGITETEIALGTSINSEFTPILKDNKIITLLDTKINWDNGEGSKSYDVHEEIILGDGLKIQTNLDDKELNSLVVLENDQALEYKYVFDDEFEATDDADELYLTILGKEYEILSMDSDSLTVSLSEEKIVKVGDSITVDGVTLIIGDVFDDSIEIGGNLIKEGSKKTVNGIEVYVDTVAYHSSGLSPSKAMIKVGKDMEKTFENGEEYIEGDETWEWTINHPGEVDGWIGVKYNLKSVSYDEDEDLENAVGIGESYILPENYGAVTFDGLTDVDYEDFEIYFDDKKVYDGEESEGHTEDVAILEGETEESIVLEYDGRTVETNTIYFKYVEGDVEIYFKDGDVDNSNEGRIQFVKSYNETTENIAKLIVDDTELEIGLILGEEVILTLEDTEVELGISEGIEVYFDRLKDVSMESELVSNFEEDVMNHKGMIVRSPEDNAEDDRVVLSIPSEKVYAEVSVKGQGTQVVEEVTEEVIDDTTEVVEDVAEVISLGGVIVKDSEIANVKDKNLILVGGSCINAETAKYLGGKACGEEFTLQTGVIAGQALVQTFTSGYNPEKIAVIVAGYNAADTTRAVNTIIGTNLNIDAGQKHLI